MRFEEEGDEDKRKTKKGGQWKTNLQGFYGLFKVIEGPSSCLMALKCHMTTSMVSRPACMKLAKASHYYLLRIRYKEHRTELRRWASNSLLEG
jgi:hypothetical protein